ncbi:SAM-dependent methyltransferase [Paucilactobacillus nenjiangensis]|jgi:hypothetical protein|uniref:SAM-dependent methyltransferase n=1 Tax=Paucilactobacillus nenjiangensis TaxID=1296540 RepID=UPI003BB05E70
MNPKQLKQLKKRHKAAHQASADEYITELTEYANLFEDYPTIKFLINNVLESDRLLKNGLLPQPLPKLLLPDDIQDQIFEKLASKYPQGDPEGDQLWEKLSAALPKLDQRLRNYREYLETTYGMWAYINAPFIKNLSEFTNDGTVLEIMAGRGFISKGLRNLQPTQTIMTTDNLDWQTKVKTNLPAVTAVENLDALESIKKYGSTVDFVIISWAPDTQQTDWEILQLLRTSYPEIQLIVIGEYNGATNSKAFWQHADLIDSTDTNKLNQNYHSFDLIDEKVYLVK